VGHSLAGNELTYLGIHFPARVRRIVYIDAAYDFTKALTFKDPVPSREPGAAQLSSYAALTAWRQFELGSKSPAIAADIRELCASERSGLVPRSSAQADKAILANAIQFHPNYTKLRVPALALYAPKTKIEQPAPTFTKEDREKSVHYFVANIRPWMLSQKQQFTQTVRCGAAYEVPGVAHMMFIERPKEVSAIVDGFLEAGGPCHPVLRTFESKQVILTLSHPKRFVPNDGCAAKLVVAEPRRKFRPSKVG
jgi:pimeloyl-ACP methyl ester carboxylesterase